MAPRKKSSSGARKSSNQNREKQQQQPPPPSQPSKFGIQHFFELHSQSEKAHFQNNRKRDNDDVKDPISVHAAPPVLDLHNVSKLHSNGIPDNALNSSETGAQSHGSERNVSMGNASSEFAPEENTFSSCVDLKRPVDSADSESGKRADKLEVFEVKDNILATYNEENPKEVSPEVSKSMSAKRFKFSPGMLIKQSQDDGIDEVTWKISPVNERLHAMSKQFPGMIKVLGDSSRFNSLNFQQCAQKKMQKSLGLSGKLEKCLSSPPLNVVEKFPICSNMITSRKVEKNRDSPRNGSSVCTNDGTKFEVIYTRSPFSTPPSLSCSCIDMASKDADSAGVSDQLGPRQHKKALIELLDQVEDVISVQKPFSKDNETFLDSESSLRTDPISSHDPPNSEECNPSLDVGCNFLVLEVSEKHEPSILSGPQPACKVLRLLNEQSGLERILQLWDEWYFSVIVPGDTVRIIGEFDCYGKCDVDREKNFVIVHPDILVSGTRVSASFSCPRRTILDERLKYNEYSGAALMGTLLHQIFQAGLLREFPTKEFLEEYARIVLQKNIESLYACGVKENDTLKALFDAIPKMLNWISCFRDSQGPRSPSIDFKSNDGVKKIRINEVLDIEEMAWAPKYGLKGMIDASVRVRIDMESAETSEVIMPLEFKTGKATNGLAAMEHNAQVMLYTLLMSERYMKDVEFGLLYYLHTDQTQGISVRRSDLIGLIMRRNELVNDLLKALNTQQFPPMLQSPNMCKGCRHLDACTVYHKTDGGTAESSGLGDMFDQLVSHLTTSHTDFLRKWENLIDLEAKQLEAVKNEIWSSEVLQNVQNHTGLSSLVLDGLEKSSQDKFCRGNRFVYRFVYPQRILDRKQANGDALSFSFMDSTLRSGDYVILSTEPGHLRVSNGVLVDISSSHVSVSFGKRLRLPGYNPSSMAEVLNLQSWRIDKDEIVTSFAIMRFNLVQLFLQHDNSFRLRKMIVDLEIPRFDGSCIASQDPSISYVWSEKSLNDDQRRAIIKILTAKDYSLILGMPGTGKTSTMVHAVKALLIKGSSILLTSYTNSAVDNLLIKLKAQGVNFIRIGRCEAVHEEVQENCSSVMDMNSTLEIKSKLDETSVVAVTCLGITSPLLANRRFDVCIMDEAGQITLPVSLGPLTLASKFVLVGDHYQLPPLVQSPEARENGMAVSLFSRLSEAHPQSIAVLHSQYRMCSAIMELSNCLIYGNRLRCGSSVVECAKLSYNCSEPAPEWLMEVLNPNQPVIFVNTDLLPAYEKNDGKAVNNPCEAYIIAEVTKALMLRGIEGQDIGVITPYNSQANLIRNAVSELVEVHTIDKYQGRDKDCILLSFVRSNENPRNHTSSLLGDWHRINVALTRAKKKLIMVGSCRTLSKVPLLKLLIEKVEQLSGMMLVSKKDINNRHELNRCSQFR